MSQEVRQRTSTAVRNASSEAMNDEADELMMRPYKGLSAPKLINASPIQHGGVYKLHIPIVYSLCPTFLKRLISSGWWPCPSLSPQWRPRHLILLGRYLYRFKDENGSKPKGEPIPLERVHAKLVNAGESNSLDDDFDGMEYALQHLPDDCDCAFAVTSLGKTQYFAIRTREEATTWVHSLGQARQETITRSLGHAENMPYPKNWEYYDHLGTSLLKSKQRVKRRMEETNNREMEMTEFADRGPLPRGYYG